MISPIEAEPDVEISVMNRSASSADILRNEVLWDEKNENQLLKWQKDINERISPHILKSKKYKFLYHLFVLPTVIIPLFVGVLSTYINQCKYASAIIAVLMLLNAILSASAIFFKFNKKDVDHSNAACLYDKMKLDLEHLLCLHKRDRPAADVTMLEYKMKLQRLHHASSSI